MRTAGYFQHVGEADLDPQIRDDLMAAYGSVSLAMLNLFKCGFGGREWNGFYEALVPTGVENRALFLFFVAFTQIAVLNIILGLFVDQAIKSMESEKDELAQKHADDEV